MKIEQVGVQLYTLREHLETPEDYQETLQKVAEIGYKSVQVAGPRPLSPSEIGLLCEEKGLVINATHEDSKLIMENPAKVIENLDEFGCRYASYPWPGDLDFSSEAELFGLIEGLRRCGRSMTDAGKVLTYHNHDIELKNHFGRDPVLEVIYRETEAEELQAEIDTYWVHASDASPEAWCARLRGRLPLLHLKDYAIGQDGEPDFAEVGSGVLDFNAIIAVAEASGCQWFNVEQDTCPGDPFESIEKSFRYIYDNLVER